MNIFKVLKSKNSIPIGLPILSFISLFILYYPAHHALLIDDGLSGIYEMKTQGWDGFKNSYGIHSLYFGHYGFLAMEYAILGFHDLGWFTWFVLWHTINTCLIYAFFSRLYHHLGFQNAQWIALSGSILFMLCPSQLENITWAATSHYNLSLFLLLISINLLLTYLVNGKRSAHWVYIILCFTLGLFTLEVAFIFPVIYGLLYILLKITGHIPLSGRRFWMTIVLPCFLSFGLYLLLFHLKNHSWIPKRFDEEITFTLAGTVTHLAQYLIKLVGCVHYTDYETRDAIYSSCLHWKKVIILLIFVLGILSYLLYRKDKKTLLAFLFLVAGMLLACLPFMHYYFMYLFRYENDRYQYFLSVFLFQALTLLCSLAPKKLSVLIILIYVFGFVCLITKGVNDKQEAATLHHQYLYSLPITKSQGQCYLLNVPNYCLDHYEFRALYRLPIALQTLRQIPRSDALHQILFYYAKSTKDSFQAKQINDSTYSLSALTNGSWWMYESIGASDYENEDYSVKLNGNSYELRFKHALQPSDQLWYFNRGKHIQIH